MIEYADAPAACRGREEVRQEDRKNPRQERAGTDPVLGKIRLPGFRLHHPGDRAAAVLVQQPLRRLSGLRRPRRRAAYRRGSRHPRQGDDLAQGRDRAVGEIVLALLHPDADRARQVLQVHARHQVEGPAEEDAGRAPARLRRRRDQVLLRGRRPLLRHQEAVRGRHHQSRAPLPRDRERMGARGTGKVFLRHSLRGLQRLSPQARSAVRQDRRQAHRRNLRAVGARAPANGSRPCRRRSTRSRTRSPRAC